jgi:hypothetical protein
VLDSQHFDFRGGQASAKAQSARTG